MLKQFLSCLIQSLLVELCRFPLCLKTTLFLGERPPYLSLSHFWGSRREQAVHPTNRFRVEPGKEEHMSWTSPHPLQVRTLRACGDLDLGSQCSMNPDNDKCMFLLFAHTQARLWLASLEWFLVFLPFPAHALISLEFPYPLVLQSSFTFICIRQKMAIYA